MLVKHTSTKNKTTWASTSLSLDSDVYTKRNMQWLYGVFAPAVCLFLVSCQSSSREDFSKNFNEGNMVGAIGSLKVDNDTTPSETVLEDLQLGVANKLVGDFKTSNVHFDRAEKAFKDHDEKMLASKIGSEVGTSVVNDTIRDFSGRTFDKIMSNTYKAANYMVLKDEDNARIELNRADDRRRRAIDNYQSEITKKHEKQKDAEKVDTILTDSKFKESIDTQYTNLGNFKAYPEFVNPYSTYLAGLFNLLAKTDNLAKSNDLFKEVVGMLPNNSFIKEDWGYAYYNQKPKNQVWVIYENGLGPKLDEFRVDLPIGLLGIKEVSYVGMALPKVVERGLASENFTVFDQPKNVYQNGLLLADMDAVFKTEFKKEYMETVRRAIQSTIVKALAQYGATQAAGKEYGRLASIVTGVGAALLTQADTRSWDTLPKYIMVARVNKSNTGDVRIKLGANEYMVKLGVGSNHVVFVRQVTPGSNPHISIANF